MPMVGTFKSSPKLNPRSSTFSDDYLNKSHKEQLNLPSPKDELKNLISDQNEYILDMVEEEDTTVKYIHLKDKTQRQLFVDSCKEKGIMPNHH